jgi:hypothetical protein
MKALFLSRQLREKILVVGLVAAALAVWVNHLLAANRTYRSDRDRQTVLRKTQEDLFARETAIHGGQRAIVEKLNPADSIRDETSLDIAIDQLARTAKVAVPTRARGNTVPSSQLTIIRKDYTFRDLDPSMADLIPLYRLLSAKAPAINIVNTTISLTNAGGGRGRGGNNQPGTTFAAGGTANFNNTATANPRGARGVGTQPSTIGVLDIGASPTGATRGGGRGGAGALTTQPTGPRLNVTFTLTAISITSPAAARGAAAPAARGAAAPRPAGSS